MEVGAFGGSPVKYDKNGITELPSIITIERKARIAQPA